MNARQPLAEDLSALVAGPRPKRPPAMGSRIDLVREAPPVPLDWPSDQTYQAQLGEPDGPIYPVLVVDTYEPEPGERWQVDAWEEAQVFVWLTRQMGRSAWRALCSEVRKTLHLIVWCRGLFDALDELARLEDPEAGIFVRSYRWESPGQCRAAPQIDPTAKDETLRLARIQASQIDAAWPDALEAPAGGAVECSD